MELLGTKILGFVGLSLLAKKRLVKFVESYRKADLVGEEGLLVRSKVLVYLNLISGRVSLSFPRERGFSPG